LLKKVFNTLAMLTNQAIRSNKTMLSIHVSIVMCFSNDSTQAIGFHFKGKGQH